MKTISNMKGLQQEVSPVITGLVDRLAKEVYQTLNYFLEEYYSGWTPTSYKRTGAFLRAAVKVDAESYGNGVRAIVCIDYKALDDYVNATGYQVADWANKGLHGGLSVSHKLYVWDDTMDETIHNNSLLRLAVAYLEKKGIPVIEKGI